MIGSNSRRKILIASFSFLIFVPSTSRAVSLQVSTATAHPGNSIIVQITVDQPAGIPTGKLYAKY